MRFGDTRLGKALRAAVYPALEPAETKRFEALSREARNARNAGDLAGAEQIYLRAMADAEASSDLSHLNYIRHGLAQVYQEQQKYTEAESIFHDQLKDALKLPEPGMQIHSAHMGLARLYNEQKRLAQVEEHYKLALAETEKPKLSPERELYGSTALWLARFYVEQHRYADAEPLFRRMLEIREASHPSDQSIPHYLQELASICAAQEKYAEAEELYRRALKIAEDLDEPKEFLIVRALDELARFYAARNRYPEAEGIGRRRLAIVEEKIRKHTADLTKRLLRRPNDKILEATIKHAEVPISEALDRLAEIYEAQDKYVESEPLRKRSLEIKQQAWGEDNVWVWVDALAAHAVALHRIGRDQEANKLDERVNAAHAMYPNRRASVHFTSRPLKKTLRGRFNTFIHALRHPSPR
jgi:tetratricopeptide (TPR) repeat protein